MKNSFSQFLFLVALQISAVFSVLSCSKDHDSGNEGGLRLSFKEDMYKVSISIDDIELPDTNDFILDIRNSGGKSIYSGYYGDSPETLSVPAGNYTVSVKSGEFSRPQFSRPQFGDEQCVVVPAEGVVNVKLECRQINSGIRLRISPDFLTVFPDGVLFLSSDDGRLMYGYSEKRIAYFKPGNVSVILNDGNTERTLLTRSLESQEILTLGISVSDDIPDPDENGISISVDTTRIWRDEDYVIGNGDTDKGDAADNALSVGQARERVGESDVWVYGYIVGGDLTKTSVSFTPPFSSETNIAVATRSSVDSRESCLSVFLPSGDVRDRLNLVDHPENIGKRVYLKGDIVGSYFGLVGIKNVTDCVLK